MSRMYSLTEDPEYRDLCLPQVVNVPGTLISPLKVTHTLVRDDVIGTRVISCLSVMGRGSNRTFSKLTCKTVDDRFQSGDSSTVDLMSLKYSRGPRTCPHTFEVRGRRGSSDVTILVKRPKRDLPQRVVYLVGRKTSRVIPLTEGLVGRDPHCPQPQLLMRC